MSAVEKAIDAVLESAGRLQTAAGKAKASDALLVAVLIDALATALRRGTVVRADVIAFTRRVVDWLR